MTTAIDDELEMETQTPPAKNKPGKNNPAPAPVTTEDDDDDEGEGSKTDEPRGAGSGEHAVATRGRNYNETVEAFQKRIADQERVLKANADKVTAKVKDLREQKKAIQAERAEQAEK